jgi:hypothetical protein
MNERPMKDNPPSPSERRWRGAAWATPVFVWAIWVAMLAASILFIRYSSRNIPFFEEFQLVPAVTGHEPVTLSWAWRQSNEHRLFLPRLILVGLMRYVVMDFRAALYLNAGLVAAAGAMMLVLVRRLRGYWSAVDAVLPVSAMSLGQAECYLQGYAVNHVLNAWLAYALIVLLAGSAAKSKPTGWLVFWFGLLLVLLPLSSGGGLAMLPPLLLWLAVYLAWGWWSGRDTGGLERAMSLTALMAASGLAALYLGTYARPLNVPRPQSLWAVGDTTREFLSLVLGAKLDRGGWIAMLLIGVTLTWLVIVGVRRPAERPRAAGLAAVLLGLLILGLTVGWSRSGLGPGSGRGSRYITLSAPLLSAVYVAWLIYGPGPARRAVHLGLLAAVCLAIPFQVRIARDLAEQRRLFYQRLERQMEAGMPGSQVVARACPMLYPDPELTYQCFRMLKQARVGRFTYFVDDRLATVPGSGVITR